MKATDMTSNLENKKGFLLLIHIMAWGLVFGTPFFFLEKDSQEIAWKKYLDFCIVPFSSIIVFYANYLFLINRLLFKRQIIKYVIINIVIIATLMASMEIWRGLVSPKQVLEAYRIEKRQDEDNQIREYKTIVYKGKPNIYKKIFFTSRDLFPLVLIIGLSVAIRMTQNWYNTESERRELEKIKTEAELKNLKNQLNPHFLFNTLNNIYSLIAFSPEKAQQSIHDLSKLLRYVLYDNQQFVPISKEIVFIENYIALMKIRLSDAVQVDVNISKQINPDTKIAPLLFITLIENAFKHGVSYSEPSFIKIDLHEDGNKRIVCQIENSYFPKNDQDKSGSGIGLVNLQKRLALLYPEQYTFTAEKKGNIYQAILILPML